MQSIPVALYQMDVIFGDADSNIEKIRNIAKQVKEENTLLVLPELCLTGYSSEEIQRTAFSENNNNYIEKLAKICRESNLLIFGSVAEFDDDQYFNTAVFVDSTGIIAAYRKTHLFGPMGEKSLFGNGDRVVSMSYNEISYGLSICYDLRFPGMYQKLADKGVQIILVVAEWPITRISHWSALLQARAIENQVYVIGVNRVGTDGSYDYGGHSAIYSPYGDIILEIKNSKENLAFTLIDLDLIGQFREKFDIRKDKIIDIDSH